MVQQVEEYYADFLAIHQEIFTLNVPSVVGLGGDVWDEAVFDRIHQGVCAMLLALKRRPRRVAAPPASARASHPVSDRSTLPVAAPASQVRFQHGSERAMRIAESLSCRWTPRANSSRSGAPTRPTASRARQSG